MKDIESDLIGKHFVRTVYKPFDIVRTVGEVSNHLYFEGRKGKRKLKSSIFVISTNRIPYNIDEILIID